MLNYTADARFRTPALAPGVYLLKMCGNQQHSNLQTLSKDFFI